MLQERALPLLSGKSTTNIGQLDRSFAKETMMCCFSQPVISVNNTRIFARLSGRGTQFLAYQMNYQSQNENSMILPLPVRRPSDDKTIKFIDLSDYDNFFDDLDNGFPYEASFSLGCSLESKTAVAAPNLEVFEVGNYIASFVPTLSDFDRLDARFRLPSETWEKMPRYKNFGFAVFQLAAGSLKPHPMAFEFPTYLSQLFFPTVHIHDGQVHQVEEFDHLLYMQHAGLDSRVHGYQNCNVADASTGLVRSKYAASQFCNVAKSMNLINGDLLLHRQILHGPHPNVDTVYSISGDPNRPRFNLRRWRSYIPGLVAVGIICWFLNRRSRLRKFTNLALSSSSKCNICNTLRRSGNNSPCTNLKN
ncbi:MAG: hypothetical protein U0930_03535 [Pirellulales bacterium]